MQKSSSTRNALPLIRNLFVVGILVVGVLVFLNFWTFRPTVSSQEFVRRILNGQFKNASQMVIAPSRFNTESDTHSIQAIDGSSCDVPVSNCEFHVLNEPVRPLRDGMEDYLQGRVHFQLCATWKDNDGASHLTPIYCTSHGYEIVIDHVGIWNR